MLPTDSAKRKEYPIWEGFMKYFPDAIAAIAHHSWVGNQKHNPGQPLHWSKGKSDDHRDCEMRHLLDATKLEEGSVARYEELEVELTAKAWRALADLQVFFDKKAQRQANMDMQASLANRAAQNVDPFYDHYDGPEPVSRCTYVIPPSQILGAIFHDDGGHSDR